jgi:hypothetical protein
MSPILFKFFKKHPGTESLKEHGGGRLSAASWHWGRLSGGQRAPEERIECLTTGLQWVKGEKKSERHGMGKKNMLMGRMARKNVEKDVRQKMWRKMGQYLVLQRCSLSICWLNELSWQREREREREGEKAELERCGVEYRERDEEETSVKGDETRDVGNVKGGIKWGATTHTHIKKKMRDKGKSDKKRWR